MKKQKISVDIAIVGGGIAGSHLAQLLAHKNISVALIDHKPIDDSGPNWINAVPLWMYDEAGLSRPKDEEVFDYNERFIVRNPKKTHRIIINELDVADINMKALSKRLKNKYIRFEKNAHYITAFIVAAHHDDTYRLKHVVAQTDDHELIHIEATLFVDASGMKGVLRKMHPQKKFYWPDIKPQDTCTAAQKTFYIRDREGAKIFLEKNKVEPKDILADVGIMGGYSLFRVQIDNNLETLSILTGISAKPSYPGAHKLIHDFQMSHSFLGEVIISGQGAIPLNAPYHRLSTGGLALLAESACQVYAAHGSGIGISLIAAKILFDVIFEAYEKGQDFGAEECLKEYDRAFHKRFYQRLYFAEHFRRFCQDLCPQEINKLIESGVLNDELMKQTLLQEDPKLSFSSLRSLCKGVLKSPKSFTSLMPVFHKAVKGKYIARSLSK